jgi:hypothetical protein
MATSFCLHAARRYLYAAAYRGMVAERWPEAIIPLGKGGGGLLGGITINAPLTINGGAVPNKPPLTLQRVPLAWLNCPPLTLATKPLATLLEPPLTLAAELLIVLR